MPGPDARLKAIWHFCRDHQDLIFDSAQCGCFHCLSLFPPQAIEDFIDDLSTAVCPRCGIDAVLPDVPLYELSPALLREMHEVFFQSSTPGPSPDPDDNGITVRMLRPDEADLLSHVAPDVFDEPLRPDSLTAFQHDPRHHLAVALHGGTVIGMASALHYVHPDKEPELFINEVGVADDWQGHGLGTRLVQTLLTHARTLGCTSAWTLTETDNAAARHLYEKCGGRAEEDVVLYELPINRP